MTHKQSLIKFAGSVLAGILLGSCTTVGPSYTPPNPELPAQWSKTAVGVSAGADAKIEKWWTLFHDPLLDSLIARAMEANQDLRMAEARVREARAQRQMAASQATPSVGASGASTNSRTGENTLSGKANLDLFQAGFDVNWEIDIFGGIRRATEAADAAVDASMEDKRDVLVSLAAEVARNYIELRGTQRRLAITRQNIDLQKQTVDMVTKRLQLGFGGELAVVQAETQLAMTSSQVPSLETAVDHTMRRLALLLGRTPETLIPELKPEAMIPAMAAQALMNLPSDLLRQRPDIRRAERQLAVATAEIGVATAELFPSFSLAGLIGLESTAGISKLVTSGSKFWSVGPKVNWSLFDGGRIRAGIEASNSRRDRAEIFYEKTVLSSLVEVENALTAYSREQDTNRILQTAVAKAGRALTISRNLYGLGLVDFLNVLQSEQSVQQSQDQLVQSEQRLSLNMVSLYKALGGGWQMSNPDA